MADRFTSLDWPKVLFRHRQAVTELYPKLISHGMQCFGAKEVMGFLGRKLVGQFHGEIITDVLDLAQTPITLHDPNSRYPNQARVGHNFIKMDDKAGLVLRLPLSAVPLRPSGSDAATVAR